MTHDLPGPRAAAAQSEILIRVEELHDEVLGVLVQTDQVVPPDNLAVDDLLVEPHEAGVGEGGLADQHLVEEDAEGPPVHGPVVAAAMEDLWREVLRSPAHRPRGAAGAQHLGEPEVRDDDVTRPVQENVLRLEVPVDDVETVEVGQGGHDLGGVEGDAGGGEPLVEPHEGEQFAPAVEREEEIQVVFVLPTVNNRNYERILDLLNIKGQNVKFGHERDNLCFYEPGGFPSRC